MKVTVIGKIITANAYDVKVNGVPTGEKKLNRLAFLIDDDENVALSGNVIHPFCDKDNYVGMTDLTGIHQFDSFQLSMDMSTYNNETKYRLFNMTKNV